MAAAVDDKDIPVSLLKNYIRLQYLLNTTASTVLRQEFRNKWKAICKSDWENQPTSGSQFVQTLGDSLHKRVGSIQKNLLEGGDIRKWDLLLLVDAIGCLEKRSLSKLDTLKKIRNQIAHHGSMAIGDTEFEATWQTVSTLLIEYGVSQVELDDVKKIGLEDRKPKLENHLNEANKVRAEELKANGNELFKREKYRPAIFMYTQAIQLPGIPSNDLAVLYSNRSLALLNSGDFASSKEDAKGAIHLRPSWWKAYSRLAAAYKALERYPEALNYFNIAHGLDPNNAELKDDRDHCIHLLEKRRRAEHLDPMYHTETFEEVSELMEKNFGVSKSGVDIQSSSRINATLGLAVGLCGQGHNYRHGRGVKQDYVLAAKFYREAADQGSAEGLYNLAELTKDGLGVRRNIAEGVRLLKMAAEQDAIIDLTGTLKDSKSGRQLPKSGVKIPNLGVKEAEHSLGLAYQNGIGVDLNCHTALYWYERAIKHSSGCSANNVALMYSEGEGPLEPNFQKAVHYWKIGASMKTVRAIENLALGYLSRLDLKNAKQWYVYAVHCGSVSFKLENKYRFEYILEKDFDLRTSMDIDAFERQLSEDIRNGPLYQLVPEVSEHELYKNMLQLSQGNVKENTTHFQEKGLKDPYRVEIITTQRAGVHLMCLNLKDMVYEANPAPLKPELPDLIGLKPIYFQNMTAKKDHVYEGFVIKLTIIEDAILGRPSIPLIAEDEKGDAQRIFIYNFKQDEEIQNSLGYGCRISVMNPYFRITLDGMPALRVDDAAMIFLHPNLTDKKRCRYCGASNGTLPCRKCKRAYYCSKGCMKRDSKLLNHDQVCKKRL